MTPTTPAPTEPTEPTEQSAAPGLDLERLGTWLGSALPELGPITSAELIEGGKSNLTYVVSDGCTEVIVRRPPLGQLLATAHDMGREYRVMSALRDTDVPVPVTYARCADPEVIGAPFYVMQRVDGRPYRFAAEIAALGPQRTRAISGELVDVLARLHAIDPASVGLADFGRPDGFLDRQVERWRRQLEASYTRDLPAAGELHARLRAGVPASSAPGIVHGDYRLDNVLVDAQDRAAAVIDWELATVGDPLTDLALMLVYGRLALALPNNPISDVAVTPGFLGEDEIVTRYADGSDRDLSHLPFHLGLATFKLVGVLEGVHHRHVHGQTLGDGFSGVGDIVPPLLEQGLAALKEHH